MEEVLTVGTRSRTRRLAFGGVASLGAVALVAGCGSAPDDSGSDSGGSASGDFKPCMVSDAGGFDDKSFNQLGYEGLVEASDSLGVEPITVESASPTDYNPNISNLIDQGCNLILTVGFDLADATKSAAEANTDIDFAIIDDSSIDLPNVKPLTYDAAQSAFLAGYAAASFSKTGIVGTFGGSQLPTVTIFMDGFADGVNYFNQQKNRDVRVIGWDVPSQNGSFTGGFEANAVAKNTAQGLIDQNADVIFPVGGPIYQSAAQAIRDSSRPIALIGADADVYESDPSVGDLLLTSVTKGLKPSVDEVVANSGGGSFDNAPYVGTLENDGVGIAPFHDYESQVDPALQGELDAIKAGIVDGSITVESPSSPK
ncbi:BMP family ABC transporter substrate-binding protein [Rhodococcus sp. BP-252]|uniref:BMP family ABC transporter substrate-binding protein n=1 Tax=Rhodococcoides kyotonense TaxID=398843 RepID=A0A177YC71_9NOCA|nr:BMP family ABC transporter substrate-binding protein [Rhodococcus sp. BP-320]MBY6418346.1 BMP family ABC transporter substrate-binding protein [Rhodococcus sp. BP-321]MBY6422471.1 BMP family ABC transporter substrate-binding protein [Rhodococcus sp. BP-324]MBY6428291.1 BMP family ABC transporter substrate-binding protein [Rhodococcus sp. BP-323]MBY6433468.1 BMP family ABC transporter substrate-binding protein [Rhodococcus sp. BP-322]MBY6442397.1 BMP family ABC transporter substrate-binding 